MNERKQNHEQFVKTAELKKGIALAKRLGPPMYADLSGLSEKEEEMYHEGFRVLMRAYELKEILGDAISPEAAAEAFADLSEQLRAAIKSRDKRKEEEFDEKLVKIASAYGLSHFGLGNVLSCVSGRCVPRGGIDYYEKEIAKSKLREGIKEAMEFVS
jgi:hypothetical protein